MLHQFLSKIELQQVISKINQRQQGDAFSSVMVEKVLGVAKPWKQLNKSELCQILEAWEKLLALCPHTSDWKTIKVSDRLLSVTGDGQRWVDYFGFASFTPAAEFVRQILPDCQWAMIRKSGKRLNASIEAKVWGLSAAKYQELVDQEKTQNIPSMIMVYDAVNGGKYQTYIQTNNPEVVEKFKDLILK
jgi:hypothetical protein